MNAMTNPLSMFDVKNKVALITGASGAFGMVAARILAVLRALQAATEATHTAALQTDAACVYVSDAAPRVESAARSALAAMAEGDTLRMHLAALRRLLKVTPVNTVVMRRRLADAVVDKAGYMLG